MKKHIAILLASILLLSACSSKNTAEPNAPQVTEPGTSVNEPAETPQVPETDIPAESGENPGEEKPADVPPETPAAVGGKLDAAADWVVVTLDETLTGADEDGNSTCIIFRVPAFNVAGDDAARLNMEIASVCEERYSEITGALAEGCSPACECVDFVAFENENILSILLAVSMPDDCVFYSTWNLNKDTGLEITGPELLDCFDYTENAFAELAIQAAGAAFIDIYGDPDHDEFCREQYEKTISPDGFNAYMPLFLNDDGNLCLIAPVFSLAGADYYETIIVLESFG